MKWLIKTDLQVDHFFCGNDGGWQSRGGHRSRRVGWKDRFLMRKTFSVAPVKTRREYFSFFKMYHKNKFIPTLTGNYNSKAHVTKINYILETLKKEKLLKYKKFNWIKCLKNSKLSRYGTWVCNTGDCLLTNRPSCISRFEYQPTWNNPTWPCRKLPNLSQKYQT